MKNILVDLGPDSYNITIGSGILNQIDDLLQKPLPGSEQKNNLPEKAIIITDDNVVKLYGDLISRKLSNLGVSVKTVSLTPGEENKTLEVIGKLYEEFFDYKMDRKSLVVALGGGVTGDIAGFAASTFMRGTPYIQIPTTLLAQVDSSVGGKTGVNHPRGKNMIGSFYQPQAVFIDTDTLASLPERELIVGIVEVIKYGVIRSKEFFEYIDNNLSSILALDNDTLEHIVSHSCETKANVVQEDEKEGGIRAILNYGHTIGHAVEALTGYRKYRHGEAVAIGMIYASKIAREMGMVDNTIITTQETLLKKLNAPTQMPDLDPALIVAKLYQDKKTIGGKLRFVLPEDIGKVIVTDKVTEATIYKILKD